MGKGVEQGAKSHVSIIETSGSGKRTNDMFDIILEAEMNANVWISEGVTTSIEYQHLTATELKHQPALHAHHKNHLHSADQTNWYFTKTVWHTDDNRMMMTELNT